MKLSIQRQFGVRVTTGVALCCAIGFAQVDPATIQPLRTAPVEKFTVNPGFRDWGPTTVAGTTILGGNQTGAGGIFAVDVLTGKLKWSFRPSFPSGTASVSTAPAVSDGIVITPFSTAYPGAVVAVSLATGKELWRGLDPAQGAAVAVSAGVAFIMTKDGTFYALDAASGRVKWKASFNTNRAGCSSRPIVRDNIVYFTGSAGATPGDAANKEGNYLFALDAGSGQERWRYRAVVPYVYASACLTQPVVTETTIFAAGDNRLYAINRATGRDRWQSIEVRRTADGRERPFEVRGLVDANSVLIGLTSRFLIAFDKASGRTVWEIPGQYYETQPSTAVAGNVLYFQGSPASNPAAKESGTLHALDLNTRQILWSFSRKTKEPNWSFGKVTPVDGGLWVDSYQALVKLQ